MDTNGNAAGWISRFDALREMEPRLAEELERSARLMTVPAGEVVFRVGDRCESYLLVLDGSVRVQRTAESGREIVLYHVDAGESCVLTTACLLSREPYSAMAITDTEVLAVSIPALTFDDALERSGVFRRFVFSSYGARVASLMVLIEEVAFARVDLRLAKWLSERRQTRVEITHQALASELGTAREVVSRQLKAFEQQGLVALSRGCIEVVDRSALLAVK